ncbi:MULTISPECIES: L-threonylcarbamoyladenylate synthase [Deefgea]|uniref:Threonylcarbamoyl-AMP synthase n=1 Tax=Deefgea chitinilytica TaxID=570276 RepID=A0ABS2C914_9NEIS|nr:MULTISPECIES: L-threonylcarbamoyladenylate synthase [Deefgea]MBM5570643.1 threonylcarbamoyl-AMP synthase [Deefgea chitinilytica]MBM9887872.1 threonylcarbamoyl-AMP synthase [Deefgea sp. CFH1-16]
MSQFFSIHAENPQARLIKQAADIIRKGGLVVYPTDSCYAIGCSLDNKSGVERIRKIRQLDDKHHFTLACRDLSQLGNYARVDNQAFRLLKAATPGSYTFILLATKEVPRRVSHPKKLTIGLRVPDHPVALALLEELGEPLLSSSLLLPNEEFPMTDAWEIRDRLEHDVDLVIEGGYCGIDPTTVVDLSGDMPQLIREGKGALDLFSFN